VADSAAWLFSGTKDCLEVAIENTPMMSGNHDILILCRCSVRTTAEEEGKEKKVHAF